MDQQLLHEAATLERYTAELDQQHELIIRQIVELEQFSKNLVILSQSSEKTMLASLGRGVYLKSDILDKKLFVEVGANVFVRKTAHELKVIIEQQINRLKHAQTTVEAQLDFGMQKLQELMAELEKQHQAEHIH